MAASIRYHCPCLSTSPLPPPPHLASSLFSFHPLHSLFFCEECDAIRCNRCVTVEVSGYYCPNCLFEVPSASVRAEKNRCARNCFMCPSCRNTLSVVPSDPPDNGEGRPSLPMNSVGEPPFFLYCNYCRWDSAEVGITFEKPTGLAAQLQQYEDSAPDSLEFERLKEHFEPFIRASSLSSSQSAAPPVHSHLNSITAAASAALARDIPGVSKYTPRRSSKDKTRNKDEFPEYKSRLEISSVSTLGSGGGTADVDFLGRLENSEDVASLQQRWDNSWATSLKSSELRPLRLPLHAKRSKRCPACTHILIKPEQKAQSVRYKIKLVAANYLPSITIVLPHLQQAARTVDTKRGAVPRDVESSTTGLHAGNTYSFHLALTNPLYDPIQVRLAVQRVHVTAGELTDKINKPPFAVSLPTSSFPVAAFAEAWEYDDDDEDDMFGLDEDYGPAGRSGREREAKTKSKSVGVIEKRANVTVVGGEIALRKEANGPIKFNMLVSYTYRSDEPTVGDEGGSHGKVKAPETKTFAFYTVIDLGTVTPKSALKPDQDF